MANMTGPWWVELIIFTSLATGSLFAYVYFMTEKHVAFMKEKCGEESYKKKILINKRIAIATFIVNAIVVLIHIMGP